MEFGEIEARVSLEMPVGEDATLADFVEDHAATSPIDTLTVTDLASRIDASLPTT